MGYTIIALSAGVDEKGILQAIKQNDFSDLPYGGYLCNIPVDQWEGKFKNVLPDCLTGKDFLKKYSRTIDHVTVVNETVRYEVEACTAHPIYENERVHLFLEHVLAINNWDDANLNKTRLTKMGELMYKAHESYSGCGLGSERTDEIVALAKERVHDGVFGAKITGGGNGGTVCLLAAGQRGMDAVRDLHLQLEKKYKTTLALFQI